MKKLILIASVAAVSVLASCSSKKNWSCDCVNTSQNKVITEKSESDAESDCYGSTGKVPFFSIGVNGCTLTEKK